MIKKNRSFIATNKQSISEMKNHKKEELFCKLSNMRFIAIADSPEMINRYFCL